MSALYMDARRNEDAKYRQNISVVQLFFNQFTWLEKVTFLLYSCDNDAFIDYNSL